MEPPLRMPNEFKLAAADDKRGFERAPRPPKPPTTFVRAAKLLVNPDKLFGTFGTGPSNEFGGAATGVGTFAWFCNWLRLLLILFNVLRLLIALFEATF